MKNKDMKFLERLRSFVWLFVVVLLVANCHWALAGNIELPGFKGLEKSKKLNLQDWISVKHFGPEDKPMQEFIIAFTTRAVPSVDTAEMLSIISLPKTELQPMIRFIQTKGNSESTPSFKQGAFRVRVYSQSVVTQLFYMDGDQSLTFFNYVDSILRPRPELKEKSKHAFDRTFNVLNRLKKKNGK